MTANYKYLPDGTKLSTADNSGSGFAYLGSLVYRKDGSSYTFESTDFSGGRIYRDGVGYDVGYFVRDRLGSTRTIVDGSGNIVEQNDYYPFGGRLDNGLSMSATNRYRFSGKEQQTVADVDLLDFGARFYDDEICRWTTIDPLAKKYFSMTPYNYCGNDPVNRFDPDGNAWLPISIDGEEKGYLWIPEEDSYNKDGSLKDGLYHQAILFTDNHIFKKYYNLGSSTAIVYKADGSTESFDACTVPSDDTKYPTIPAGCYEAAVGSHKGSYTALKMFDTGKSIKNNTISLGIPNVAHPDRDYIEGADIHKAGKDDFTGIGRDGRPVSKACFLISSKKETWDAFIGIFNNDEQKNNIISVMVRR